MVRVERELNDRFKAGDKKVAYLVACWLHSCAFQVSDPKNERDVAAAKEECGAGREASDGNSTIAAFLAAIAAGDVSPEFLELWNKFGFLVLKTLPVPLRIAPGGGLADTLRLLHDELRIPYSLSPPDNKSTLGSRLYHHFQKNTPPAASPALEKVRIGMTD